MNRSRICFVVLASALSVSVYVACGGDPNDATADADAGSKDASLGADDAFSPGSEVPDGARDAGSLCLVDAAGSPTIIDAVQASIGTQGLCVLRQGSVIDCWGTNTPPSAFPPDAGAVNVMRLEVGSGFGCVLDSASRMWCWGSNNAGQVGLPPDAGSPDPHLVQRNGAPLLVDDMSVGFQSVCAIEKGSRDVYCWGSASSGALGPDAAPPDGSTPSAIAEPTRAGVAAATTARFTTPRLSNGHCLIDSTTILCWGNNANSQLATAPSAYGSTSAIPAVIADAGGVLPIVDLSLSINHACALDSAKHLWCWGINNSGSTGSLGTENERPALVPELDKNVASVSAAAFLTCAIDLQDHAHCFGLNNFGLLGDPNETPAGGGPVPTTVVGPDGGGALGPIASLATGAVQICAILEGPCGKTGPGPLYCWGNNGTGVLHNPDAGSTTAIPVPTLTP